MTSSSPDHLSLPKPSHGGVSVSACEFGDYTDFFIHSSISGCSGYFHVFIRPGIERWSPELQGDSLPSKPPGKHGTHSSLLAWRIPWTEEPGRLQSTGSHRVGHHRSNLTRLGHCEQCCSEHWVNISFQLEVSPFLDICQRVRLLDYMVDLFLVF